MSANEAIKKQTFSSECKQFHGLKVPKFLNKELLTTRHTV